MNDTLYCKNDTLNMSHFKNMFINELFSLLILLTMLMVGTNLGELASKQEKGGRQKKSQYKVKYGCKFCGNDVVGLDWLYFSRFCLFFVTFAS